jgi:hypothetical protein
VVGAHQHQRADHCLTKFCNYLKNLVKKTKWKKPLCFILLQMKHVTYFSKFHPKQQIQLFLLFVF